jgi:hypothetical protein
VNKIISRDLFGLNPDLFKTLIASIAPKTPTTPSYFPEYGIASM